MEKNRIFTFSFVVALLLLVVVAVSCGAERSTTCSDTDLPCTVSSDLTSSLLVE